MRTTIGHQRLLAAALAWVAWAACQRAQAGEPMEDHPAAGIFNGTDSSYCPPDPNPPAVPPRTPWYVRTEAVILLRDASGETDLAALNWPRNIVFSTRDLDYQFQAGPRLLIGRTLNPWNQVEFSYFALEHWNDSAAIRDSTENGLGGTGNLASPFSGFGDPAVLGLDYNSYVWAYDKSTLDSGEINFRHVLDLPPGRLSTSVLVGLRYMAVRERFQYESYSFFPAPQGTSNFVRTDTANELFGPQLGALFEFYCDDRWWVNFEMKGAVCQNAAEQTTDYRNVDENGLATRFLDRRAEHGTAWIGDIALMVVYRWTPRLSARFGYQAIWVEGLALASENFQSDINILRAGPAQLEHRGSVVYHGPIAGIELNW